VSTISDVERLPLEQQLALQESKLAPQIERVRTGAPFFAERLDGAVPRTLAELAELPFVTKPEVREAQAESPPLGAVAGVPLERIARLHVTSGTTGTPLLIGFTANDLERSTRVGARAFAAAGIRPHHVVLHCLNYAFYAGGIADHLSVEGTGAAVVPVGIGQSDRLLDLFPVLKPTAMFAITSYTRHLAERAVAHGTDPRELGLAVIVTGGEPGGDVPEVRRRIEETWGAEVGDTYGLGEVWPTLAAHCELRDGVHFTAPDLLVVELVDVETGKPHAWERGATGELVFTHLEREASPLVRYRSGDVATVLDTECVCGRCTPRVRIVGRADDMFVVRGVNVFPSAVEAVLVETVPGLRGFALVLDREPPEPPIALAVEAEETVDADRIAATIRKRLQVQVRVQELARGTFELSEHKTKRLFRTHRGEAPPWVKQPTRRAS
jgi:phenylacetate-CoA ligase